MSGENIKSSSRASFSSRSFTCPSSSTVRKSFSVRSFYGESSNRAGGALGGFRVAGGPLLRCGVYGSSPELASGLGMGIGAAWHAGPTVWPPMTEVTVTKSLLAPLTLEMDPNIQAIKRQEKEQLKILNSVTKVRHFEQTKGWKTKWSLLQEQTTSHSNIKAIFEAYIARLHRHLDSLGNEKLCLQSDLHNMQGLVEDLKTSMTAFNIQHTYSSTSEDLGTASMEATLESMIDEIDFLKQIYNEELQELQGQIKDTSVIVEMDNRRHLDMDTIVAEVCAQYEDIANRSRAEAEIADVLRSTKAEIAEYKRKIHCMHSEINAIKGLVRTLFDQIKEAEEKGELAMKQAKDSSQEVESALQRTKKDMALQVRKYQSLMNIKLALDIEIATYKKLLEGEENSIASPHSPDTRPQIAVCDFGTPVLFSTGAERNSSSSFALIQTKMLAITGKGEQAGDS
uniref:IF rod domain-containing protein n=1 Tax=Electrophorus electricus TaxID=8005 RepID=A0AAY5EEJ3_ELEEL